MYAPGLCIIFLLKYLVFFLVAVWRRYHMQKVFCMAFIWGDKKLAPYLGYLHAKGKTWINCPKKNSFVCSISLKKTGTDTLNRRCFSVQIKGTCVKTK